MKFIAVLLISLFSLQGYAGKITVTSVVLNHLMTIGRNDQGFTELPKNENINGWIFKSELPYFYYVIGPQGVYKRRYEYLIKNGEVQSIAMTGDNKQIVLYTKKACEQVYKASLEKADDSVLDAATTEIFKENKVQGPTRDKGDKLFARNYAKNCKLIFSLNQEKTLNQNIRETKTNR